jgi:hypothetical protein
MMNPLRSFSFPSIDPRLIARIVVGLALVHAEASSLLGGGW